MRKNRLHRHAPLLCLVIIGLLLVPAQIFAQMDILKVEAAAEIVGGVDLDSLATGFDVNGYVKATTQLKQYSTETSIGDPFAGPYLEFQLKDVGVGAFSSDWNSAGSSTKNPVNNDATFDYAKLVWGNYYLKLYGVQNDKDDLFSATDSSMFHSVQRVVRKKFVSIEDDNYRNKDYYDGIEMGYADAHTFADVFSVGMNSRDYGNLELAIASDSLWEGFSSWGESTFLDNRNAYAISLNYDMNFIPSLDLKAKLLTGIGYLVYDSTTVAPQKTILGLSGEYMIPLDAQFSLVPMLGMDLSYDKTEAAPEDAFEFALGGGLRLKWPGSYDSGNANLFFGGQNVYSGVTMSAQWIPNFPNIAAGTGDTGNLKMSVSMWEDPATSGLLTEIPVGFGLAFEMDELQTGAPKMDLMANVDYLFPEHIWVSWGFNYAFGNRDADKMDAGSQYYEANVLDTTIAMEWENMLPNTTFNVKYESGELLPATAGDFDLGVLTTGLLFRF